MKVGFGLGIMVPVQSTLAGELCPAKDRVFLSNFSSMFPYITGMLSAVSTAAFFGWIFSIASDSL